MKIATREIMQSIDKYTIENIGIPSIVLMENAALKVIKNLELDKKQGFVVVCGTGNNGGDGFVVARHLKVQGKNVEVFLVGSSENLSKDSRINYNILKNMGIKINKISNLEDINELRDSLLENKVTIDAIFGTGLKRELEELHKSVISIINENSEYIVSIDIPSGMDSNSGNILGNCIRAKKTITFQLYKSGFLAYGTDKYTGEVIVEDIGIPEAVIDIFHNNEFILEKSIIEKCIPIRERYGYKGDYGRTLIVAGSKGYTGAAYITTQSAVRSGAGMVTLACSEDIQELLSVKLCEAMTVSYKDFKELEGIILKSDSIAIGPGMGDKEETFKIVEFILEKAKCPVVIDADAINVLRHNLELIKNKEIPIVLTPHLGEMSKITGLSIDYIRENRLQVAKNFAKEYKVILVLKGYNTIITDGNIIYINPTGNSAMASGGMGDCLTGIIAGFIHQCAKPIYSAFCGAFIHGYIGEMLSEKMFSVNASHVIENISSTIKTLQR